MSETLRSPQKIQTHEQSEKYFSFQIKGWTNFDPMDKTLAKIAEGITGWRISVADGGPKSRRRSCLYWR